MATLITSGNNTSQQRCDARCHKAEHPECKCICGGRYHGKARQPGALEQAVKEFTTEILGAHEETGGALPVEGKPGWMQTMVGHMKVPEHQDPLPIFDEEPLTFDEPTGSQT